MKKTQNKGQTTAEAVVVLPIFLLLVFFVIQIGHILIGMAIVNYAASSIARQAVYANAFDQSSADQKLTNLLAVGLKAGKVSHTSDGDSLISNMTVTTCAELQAYPLIGKFLDQSLKQADGQGCALGAKMLGPVGLKGAGPFTFVLQGHAMARMNYNAK